MIYKLKRRFIVSTLIATLMAPAAMLWTHVALAAVGTFDDSVVINKTSDTYTWMGIEGASLYWWYLNNNYQVNGAPANAFTIENDNGFEPFTIEQDSPQNLLYLDSNGRIGVNTNVPAVDLHVIGGGGAGTVNQVFQLESAGAPQQIFKRNGVDEAIWFFAMTGDDQFKVSFNGTGKVEAKFFQNGNLNIAGALTQNSDRDSKQSIVEVDNKTVLEKVVSLPISTWEYKAETGVTHLGPMAQDFHKAFGLGSTPKGISSVDTAGVALAAIKGLNEVVQAKDKELSELKAELAELRDMVYALSARDMVVMN